MPTIKCRIVKTFVAWMAGTLLAQGAVQVSLNDIQWEKDSPVYIYTINARDMQHPERLPVDALTLENVSVKSHKGVSFFSADAGKSQAQIVCRFDFSGVPYRPVSVMWRDRLTVFPTPTSPETRVRVVSEWSTDGDHYQPIREAQTDPDGMADVGSTSDREPVNLPAGTEVVYYRVRFEATGGEGVFAGDAAQWNRSGNNAPLFRAAFKLDPVEATTEGEGIVVEAAPAARLTHIVGDQVYPETMMRMDTDRGWQFTGAIKGHSGSVKAVEAPGHPGERALLCSVQVNNFDPSSPVWLSWQYNLDPELNIQGAKELVFDIYPLEPLDRLPIMVQLGNIRGFGIIAATWTPLGNPEPGRWTTVRIPVKPHRLHVDVIKLTFNAKKAGVPENEEFRFYIDNLRLEPAPVPALSVFSDKLVCAEPLVAGYLEQTSSSEINDDEPLSFHLELSSARAAETVLTVTGRNTGDGRSRMWAVPVKLDAPYANWEVSIAAPGGELGSGLQLYTLEITDRQGRVLARSREDIPVHAFSSEAMQARRGELLERLNTLVGLADALEAEGIVVEEPMVTFAVAREFLADGGYVEYDYFEQREPAIAMTLLEHLSGMLDHAERSLRQRQNGEVVETLVRDYEPGRPIAQEDGRVLQDGRPILLIGALISSDQNIGLLPHIGMNTMATETRIKDWIPDEEAGYEVIDTFFNYGEAYGLATHMLLSSHYPPAPMPSDYAGAITGHEGVGMFPWDVLSPSTEQIFDDWYERMLPELKSRPNLASLGLANEPGYPVEAKSASFAQAFGPWAKRQYGTIERANRQWGSDYAGFDVIDLPGFFELRERSPGADYDWLLFVDEEVSEFLGRRKDDIDVEIPGTPVWVKLMGYDQQFGFTQLNEFTTTRLAQNVLGTDAHEPLWLDYLKSIDPQMPIYNTEWHFMEHVDPNYQPLLEKRMFEGVVHGINVGLIWTFRRAPWATNALGMDQSITRWPLTLDVIGRTSLRLRGQADTLTRLANLDGGRIRILYSLAANTHQGTDYIQTLREFHSRLGQNAAGTRFVFSHQLVSADLDDVDLLVLPGAEYVDAPALSLIEAWVRKGGTLWIDTPVTFMDPWGHPVTGLDSEFADALNQPGEHSYGDGAIFVGGTLDISEYCEGPWAVDPSGAFVESINIRHLRTKEGGWLSVINDSDQPVTFDLKDVQTFCDSVDWGKDVWNHETLNLTAPITLPPNGVRLICYKKTGNAAK